MNKDLTVGKPNKVMWGFCLPLFGSVIFQQMYNIADSLIAGKFVGESALAAVGNSYEITLIFIAIAFGCNIGCSVITSQFFGAGERDKVKTTVYTTMISTALICVILMLIGLLGGEGLLRLIDTPQDIMEDSLLYLRIYVFGLPFLFFYNISNGIFSALGDSKTPFYFLAASSTANVLVDLLFVKNFGMGVAGVAWATFLCQGISAVLAVLVVLSRLAKLEKDVKAEIFSFEILKKITVIAVPSMLQQSFVSIGNIILQRVINGFGTSVVAGYAAGIKLNNLVITSLLTLGNGVSNFTAQNLGAGKSQRIKEGFKAGWQMVWIICVPLFILYFFAGNVLLGFFMEEPVGLAMETGKMLLWILSPFYFVVAVKLVADGVLRGIGAMGMFMASTFTDLVIRVVLAIILSKTSLGATGIWCAWPFGWVISTAMSFVFYKISYKKIS